MVSLWQRRQDALKSTILVVPKSSRTRCRQHAVDKNPKKPQFHYHLGIASRSRQGFERDRGSKTALTTVRRFDGANEVKRTLGDLEIQAEGAVRRPAEGQVRLHAAPDAGLLSAGPRGSGFVPSRFAEAMKRQMTIVLIQEREEAFVIAGSHPEQLDELAVVALRPL
jgi:hypothetical protein